MGFRPSELAAECVLGFLTTMTRLESHATSESAQEQRIALYKNDQFTIRSYRAEELCESRGWPSWAVFRP